ncbi:TMV resistance protein N, partial [Mucuna pruriens]
MTRVDDSERLSTLVPVMEFVDSSLYFSKFNPIWTYDVFITFRGKDTRAKFVSHLHSSLSKAGVNTFLDDDNFPRGIGLTEGLLAAIEGSRICVVVFSTHYTESTWCLKELEKIIECHKTYGQLVVPIFYHVDPSHVRHQTGDFGEVLKAFAEKRFWDKSVLSRWGSVLTEAANFSGWDVSNHTRSEAKLIKEIVEDILRKLDNTLLSITEFPVGLESRIQEVIRFVENRSTKVCILGIWGMGGSGKTTTAKAIYNQIHHRFLGRSFIENIREVCETDCRGHAHLQEQLLSDLLKTNVKIHSVGMGTAMIENRLAGKKKVLIILDDVNEFGQLKNLCGNRRWFGEGSMVIITTRDLRLLTRLKVDYVYEMDKMDQNESLELF